LGGDETIDDWLRERISADSFTQIDDLRRALQSLFDTPLARQIQNARIQWVDGIGRQVYENNHNAHDAVASTLGRLAVHCISGLPILLAVLVLMYYFVGHFGAGVLVGFFEDTVFGEWINPFATNLVITWIPVPLVQEFLIGQYGVITVALT